jgi:hypothetical protein
MRSETRTLLPEYLLGVLSEASRREVEAAIEGSPEVAEEVRTGTTGVARLVDALLTVSASQDGHQRGRSRLLALLRSVERFDSFFPALRGVFNLDDEGLRTVLARMDAGCDWIDAPFAGVRYFHFQAGPAALGNDAGFLRLSPGAAFPEHVHLGPETAIVLEGSILVGGRELHPGAVVETGPGSSHHFQAGPRRDLVLMVIHSGIAFS